MSEVLRFLVKPIVIDWKELFLKLRIRFNTSSSDDVDQAIKFQKQAVQDRLRNSSYL
ncbi:MAG: hypothetical protein HON90_12045 [Halobacteriovoraceae bacterium]|jgi:hypothetical protein|nr:hypothetical protein [Halobacteriovoraceae bacterium]